MLGLALIVSLVIWVLAAYGALQLLGAPSNTLGDVLFIVAKWTSAGVFVIALVLLVLNLAVRLHETEAHRDARRRNRHGDRF